MPNLIKQVTDLSKPHITLAAAITSTVSLLVAVATGVVTIGPTGVDKLLNANLPVKIVTGAGLVVAIASAWRSAAGVSYKQQ